MNTSQHLALETRGLRKVFGGLVATDSVDFALERGARYALIGPNGAGKTTFVNLLSGTLKSTSGSVWLDGRNVTEWPAHLRAVSGLSRTFQINQLFSGLTPLQSVVLAMIQSRDASDPRSAVSRWWRSAMGDRRLNDEAMELLSQLHLGDCMHSDVGTLAYGRQRLLEIAIALAAKPKVLLLDEPAAGISQEERELVLGMIDMLPSAMSLVLIEHDMDLVFRFAKTITVLVNGAVFASGTPQEIANDPRVRKVYLGEGEHG